jgi:hypothetical protein
MPISQEMNNRERPFFAPYQPVPLNGCVPSREFISTTTEFQLHSSPAMMSDSGYFNPAKAYSSITTADLQLQQEEKIHQVYCQQQMYMDRLQHHFQQQLQSEHGPQHMQAMQWSCDQPYSQQRKSVSFNESVDVLEITHLNDIEDEEKEQIWLSKDDYARIKAEIYYHLRRGGTRINSRRRESSDALIDSSSFTFRGLETKLLQQQRRSNQREATDAVLNEQLFQRTEKSNLPEVIAMLYNVLSFPCQQHAFEVGVDDAKAVYSNNSNNDVDEKMDGAGTGTDVTVSRATPKMLFECMPVDSEIAYAGDSIVERLAQEEASYCNRIGVDAGSPLATIASVEDWLVERFQMGKLLALHMAHIRQLNTKTVRETLCSAAKRI